MTKDRQLVPSETYNEFLWLCLTITTQFEDVLLYARILYRLLTDLQQVTHNLWP